MSAHCQLLLVHGFIRCMSTVIPMEIIELCYIFYAVSTKIFIRSKKQFYITDTKTKQISTLISYNGGNHKLPDPFDMNQCAFCYIPNVTSSMSQLLANMDKNKDYDCLFGIFNRTTFSSCTCKYAMLFFESDKIDDENIKYHLYISPYFAFYQYFSCNTSLISCGNKHGVIYEYGGKLYQLLLQHIMNSDKPFFMNTTKQFIEIKQDEKFIDYQLNDDCYLSMNYLSKHDKIFAVTCHECQDYEFDTLSTKRSAKCGIFDLNENKWQIIKEYEYIQYNATANDEEFVVAICDNKYDSNIVYMVTNTGNNAKYDIHKNEWIHFNKIPDEKLPVGIKPIVWLNDNAHLLYTMYSTKSYFGCIDTRDCNNKWIKLPNISHKTKSIASTLFL